MIRVEIVIKHRSSWSQDAMERALKRELSATVLERAAVDDAEIVRIQFLGPKKRA